MPFNIQLSKIRETRKVSDVRFPIPACAGAEKLTATTLPYSFKPAIFSAVVVGLARLELATSSLSGMRSNHLSYRPILDRWAGHSTWWS
jgi:hypothetical protein